MKNLIVATLIFITFSSKAGIICIQRGSQTLLETRLDSAILHSQNDDVIYLPGGLIFGSSNLTINKRLTIIGCGYNFDSTLATGFTEVNDISFNSGSDSSILIGVYCHSLFVNSNIIINRIKNDNLYLYNGSSNTSITENTLSNLVCISSSNPSSLPVRQNIIGGSVVGFNNVSFLNNIFQRNNFNYAYEFDNVMGCFFMNNIFTYTCLYCNTWEYRFISNSNNNHFQNNLFVMGSDILSLYNNNNSEVNNYFGVSYNSIFTQNYHLQSGCVGIGAGTDGTDIGIYGTAHPFKEGGLPFNPHYQLINVPQSVTTPSGTLNVNFQVGAQDH